MKSSISHKCREMSSRSGLTIVEVLVSIGIISALMAISIPAVQSAREVSRRLACENQLRQWGVALHGYHDTHVSFPPAIVGGLGEARPDRGLTFLFPFVQLPKRNELVASGVARIPLLECPSDGDLSSVKRPVSYRLNESPGRASGSAYHGPFRDGSSAATRRISDITDGTSSTAAFSEKLVIRSGGTEAEANRQPTRYLFRVDVDPVSINTVANPWTAESLAERTAQTDASIQTCIHGPREFHSQSDPFFLSWDVDGLEGYTHWWPPNAANCFSSVGGYSPFAEYNAGANSSHPSGVNVAFIDGHVRFVSDRIDQKIWRAFGTRDGAESISEGE